ncbi:MAG: hypothetical protein GYA17_10575 [Chloroflexi bacterium]|jgi:uncharacterized membrane protein YuzA (DUF378 family)|nr:hypothetical protein [Anaerolineaceae bacterium]NMB88795.1 hypothetical protein [Chloroflexota bacterium]
MSRDLRQYARQTNFRLMAGGLIALFVIGDGLIYLLYGQSAALLGLLCMVLGLAPIVLILLFFTIMDWIVKRANRQ